MRSLGGKVQESTFCDILHNAVLQVCREKYWADSPDWEVDGVICISVPHSQEQHVVKIHQKFPSDSGKHFDNRCFECDRKPKDALSTNETSERHFNESVEEDDSSYRNVSVIDLEHASTQPNPAQTCGQGTIPPSLPSPVREQNSHNFYASPDLSGFGPNVHRQKSEQLKNSSGQSHSKTNNRSKDQEHSSSFTSHPRETTPPRKKSKTEPEEYVVVKAEPDDDEDFALHMECIDEKESDNTAEIKDENIQRDLAAETQEDINFLLNVEGPSASHQFNSGDRSWGQRLPTSTVTSQMDTNLSSMAGQGSQGFSNLNLLTHGVDIEDGTMRLTTRVQHPSFIAGQTDSNTPEQRTIPRPSGQDSAAASNAIVGQYGCIGAGQRNTVRSASETGSRGWDNSSHNFLENTYSWKDYSQPGETPVQVFGQVSQEGPVSLHTGTVSVSHPVQTKEEFSSPPPLKLPTSPQAMNVLVKGSQKGKTFTKFQHSGNMPTNSKAPYIGYTKVSRDSLGENQMDSDSYKCRFCAKMFNSLKAMNRHLRVHDQHRCKQCNQGFKSDLLLQKHNTDHHAFKFPCASCGKLFGRKFTLKRHEKYTCKISTK
ncbi:zinc finger and BTB domain-containing protein 20-like isoform X3 [Pecten maximus]|uniref:zinc finger and BTB domain-containing protein 20-like isoform X3 n=1 Tax=Pecten maximus TaxID=6579 RepID=UPI00145873F9|nr:zinc finger and BTB domain-containing protein 20-like isoform X3 [Pecten maximus]